jgi:hypothetical protein
MDHRHHHHRAHAVVEIVHHSLHATEAGAEIVDRGEKTVRVAKAISGTEAFRKYNWLKGLPVKNVSGNFRGMVVSRRFRAIFDFSEKYLEKTEKLNAWAARILLVAGMAHNLEKTMPEIERILASKQDWATKSGKLGPQVTSIMTRTLYELVAGPVRTLASSMIAQGYCGIGDLVRGQVIGICH